MLSLGPDGLLLQEPAPELQALRGEHRAEEAVELGAMPHVLDRVRGDTLEIIAEFERGDAGSFGLKVFRSADGKRAVSIGFDGKHLEVAGTKAPLELRPDEALRLHVFLDRSVLEVYANGRTCVTRVVHPEADDLGVEAFARGGKATLKSLDSWTLGSIWPERRRPCRESRSSRHSNPLPPGERVPGGRVKGLALRRQKTAPVHREPARGAHDRSGSVGSVRGPSSVQTAYVPARIDTPA